MTPLKVSNRRVRMEVKQMADDRAMEEQANRMNPLDGRGATPSMGLSQIRGGADAKAMAQGKALMDHLHSLHGAGYAKKFHEGMCGGLGTGRYEGQGKHSEGGAMFSKDMQDFSGHMKGGFWGALASLAIPLVGKLLGAGKMSKEAHDEVKKMMEEHEKKYHSGKKLRGGFWGALASVGIPLVAKLLGAGKMTKEAHDELCDMMHSTGRSQKMKGKGRVVGGASAHAMVESDSDEEKSGKGRYSNIGHSVADVADALGQNKIGKIGHSLSNIAGMFGLGKEKKQKRVVSANDGRRKRAEIVKRVMAEQGLSMINASKYVKENQLY